MTLLFTLLFLQEKPLLVQSFQTPNARNNAIILKQSFVPKNVPTREEYNRRPTVELSGVATDERGSYDPAARGEMTEAEQFQAANEILTAAPPSIELPNEIENSFMQYALSIILGRALPDARDGLKPVHRRILYAMSGLNLTPNSGYRKCARVVGEVLGKYHPHGDTAVYDALVRLAQDFSTNVPLIDGHGNFGSIDADPAAAMRYTECRLTRVANEALLDEIGQDTVDFIPNFDGNEVEPTVLPARLPILLLNGCAGIAVGMATNVPPHNLGELMDACIALTQSREEGEKPISDSKLYSLVPAPDFPTGATIMGTDGAKKLYSTGNGGIVLRAVTHIEQIKAGKGAMTRTAIIVTELPYQVNKSSLLEKIAEMVNDKKIDGIADLRDESDRDGIRVVIELKRDAVPAVVQNNLFKKTPLQTSFSGNFLALMGSGTVPRRFTLRSALECFLDFRFETIRRKTSHQLSKVVARAHIVDGLLKALERVDEVIEVIRNAPDQNNARATLMDPEKLSLSSEQANSVLKLQLGQLTRLNKDKLANEKETLNESSKKLNELMENDSSVRRVMVEEFAELKDKFGVQRKTKIERGESELNDIDLIENARNVIVVTRGGYIKRMPLKTFENQGRGTRGKKGTSSNNSSDDEVIHCFSCNDHDTLLMTTQRGIAYGLRAFQVPEGSRIAKGVPIPSVLPVKIDDVITSVLPVSEFSKDEYCVLATTQGWIKKTPLAAFENISSRGLTIATLEDGDVLKWCQKCADGDDILIGTTDGMASRFEASTLRPTGRTSRGVKAIKLKKGDTLADVNVLGGDQSTEYVLAVTACGYGKRIKTDEFTARGRGGVGVMATKFKKGLDDRLRCLRAVNEDDEVLVITSKGVIVRQKVSAISCQSRAATGVLVQKVDTASGDFIS
eukprot:CAMPEP_0176483174 /NCGR_PEP_ID=MMETSP0200_2-20121128/3780_1 /TAXON_ID=947934 /ORGANISM="Chaetoceros sp., Strain GSL56" /LENGTH=905 /DNA_ID=CAMNT_0017879563 /DNA_START=100 /DNA_END=2814 /DNA_ORIENTATION=+